LATDCAAKIHAIRHATKYAEMHEGFSPEIVVDLDVGVPLRAPEDITACVEYFSDHDVEAVVTVYEAERNPYFNMVEFNDGCIQLVKPAPVPLVRRQDAPQVYSVSPSVFAFRRDRLMSVTHLYAGRWGACVVPRERAIDIDHELDFQFVEFLLTRERNRGSA
jgi:N-acylneuraminate cytidylyltransferase/CMP-N,N'-diacetyllegionaminic acid synthase